MAQKEQRKGSISHPGLLRVAPGDVIDKSSPIPLHHQLEVFIRQGIERGLFPANEPLPTEYEIQEYFDLSRTPVRQALAKLSGDGLVVRRRSQGTIVLPRPFEENLRTLAPFEFYLQQADSEAIELLNLQDGAEIYYIHRVRFIDDEPVGDIVSCIPVAILPNLSAADFSEQDSNQSIYYVLEKIHGIKLVRATETVRAVNVSPETAKLLNLSPGSAVLMRTRVTFDTSNRSVALEYGLYRGVYHLELEGPAVSVDTTSLL